MYSAASGAKMLPRGILYFACLLFVGLLQSSPVSGELDYCTFQFLNSRTLEAVCEGAQFFRKQFKLSKTKKNIDVIPGVQLLTDLIVPGERALIAVSNRSIQLHNLQFRSPYLLERLGVAVPLATLNADVIVKNSMFSACGSSATVGGIHMSNSNASVIDSNFFNCGSASKRIAVGAVLLGDQSSLAVSRSDFFDLESRDGAVVARNNSSVSIVDSTFTKTNGISGAAVSVSFGGKAELHRSRFDMCASSEQSAVSMIGAAALQVDTCDFMSNHGLNGGAVAFGAAPNDAIAENGWNKNDAVIIKSSYFGGNIAKKNGGGLYIEGTDLLLKNSRVILNKANNEGAGLYVRDAETVTIDKCRIVENRFKNASLLNGQEGGGIYAVGVHSFALLDSRVLKNRAPVTGGGAVLKNVNWLKVFHSLIRKNFAEYGAGISIDHGKNTKIRDTNITHNEAKKASAGVYSFMNDLFSAKNSHFSHNSAGADGAVTVEGALDVKINDCLFQFNNASASGSGLSLKAVTKADIHTVKFEKNTVLNKGAAMHASFVSRLSADELTFYKNSANDGGACWIEQSDDVSIHKSTFKLNKAKKLNGASISFNTVNSVSVSHCSFAMNVAKGAAGAIFSQSVRTLTCANSDFFKNRAQSSDGGGIFILDSTDVSIKTCNFRNNSAFIGGGAASMDSVADLDISSSIFKSNEAAGLKASHGGALAALTFSNMTLHKCDFSHNAAGNNGGAVSMPQGPKSEKRSISITHSQFLSNVAHAGSGGAMFLKSAHVLKIFYSPFELNRAHFKGSAFYTLAADRVKITGGRFPGNDVEIEDEDEPPCKTADSVRYAPAT